MKKKMKKTNKPITVPKCLTKKSHDALKAYYEKVETHLVWCNHEYGRTVEYTEVEDRVTHLRSDADRMVIIREFMQSEECEDVQDALSWVRGLIKEIKKPNGIIN